MADEEKLQALMAEVVRSATVIEAYNDVLALTLAELATLAPNPAARLAQMREAEEGAAYAVASSIDQPSETVKKIMMEKAAAKGAVFNLAAIILNRIAATRK